MAISIACCVPSLKALGDLPIKNVNDAMVYIRDVAYVRDGYPPQTNIVHVDGARSVILSVLKNGRGADQSYDPVVLGQPAIDPHHCHLHSTRRAGVHCRAGSRGSFGALLT
jgi:hypothetical protein